MSSPRLRKLPFGQQVWNHYRWAKTGERFVSPGDPEEDPQDVVVLEEHWGRKETCAKCRKLKNNIGEFKNDLTALGWFYLGLTSVVLFVVGVVAVVISIHK